MATKCKWKYDETHEKWDTQCGEAFCLLDGGPKDNGMNFCPYCGKELWQLKGDWVQEFRKVK